MKANTRIFSFVALLVVLLSSACSGTATGTPTPGGTDVTASPVVMETATATAAAETATPGGVTETPTPGGTQQTPVLVQVCEFCVETVSHVILTAPVTATVAVVMFDNTTPLPEPGVECNSVETVNDKQVILCSGPHSISFRLKLCEGTNCSETQVNLPACPVSMPQSTVTATVTGTGTVTATVTGGPTSPATDLTPSPGPGTLQVPTQLPALTATPTP